MVIAVTGQISQCSIQWGIVPVGSKGEIMNEILRKKFLISTGFVVLGVYLLFFAGCGRKKNLSQMSPKEVINLYYNARDARDKKTLRRIIYFPAETSESAIKEKIRALITSRQEKWLARIVKTKVQAEYEKSIDKDTAEVGVVVTGRGKRVPFQQVILKKQDGIWKFHYSKWELSIKQLTEELRENPKNVSVYYLLGNKIRPENPAKAYRFFKKYHKLAPEGFWISDEFLEMYKEDMRDFEHTEEYEKATLAEIQNLPSHRIASKAKKYRTLGQLFTEKKDYKKAKRYFDKAVPYADGYPLTKERLTKSRKELQLRMEGKYHDILDEIEALEKKQSTETQEN